MTITRTLVSPVAPPKHHFLQKTRVRPARAAHPATGQDSLSVLEETESQAPESDAHSQGGAPERSMTTGASADIGTANKNTIRKLVHHQLLGRGYDKQDEDYVSCYSVACAAVLAALRHGLSQRPINRRQAAGVAERLLDLLLPGQL